MKPKKIAFHVLTFLPLVATLITIFFLPAVIPTKFDFLGEAVSTGSKFELLVTPMITIAFGLIFPRLWKLDMELKRQVNSEKTKTIVQFCVIGLFNVITFWSLFSALA